MAALAGGGFAAYSWFAGTGPQAAEALPGDTVAYVGIDIDPSGSQKIEAYNTLKKFPEIKKWLDDEGLDADDDFVKRAFEEAQKASEECTDVDYDDDIGSWLGKRAGFAAVVTDAGSDDGERPVPVFVVQATDSDAAEKGLEKLQECGSEAGGGEESDDLGGWTVEGDWVVLAETQEIAQEVADAGAESSLADDADFQKWSDEAGDPGVLTAYAAPEAGKLIADEMLTELEGLASFDQACAAEVTPPDELTDETDPFAAEPFESEPECVPGSETGGTDELDPELEAARKMMEDFGGGAMTVRFDDGALEMEVAGDLGPLGFGEGTFGDQASDVVASLPDDTALAYGLSLGDGWFEEFLDYAETFAGEDMELGEMLEMAEEETGLSLPEDVETLAGDALALSVSSDIDPASLFTSDDALADLPVGVKIRGDADGIQDVVGKLRELAGDEELPVLEADADGDEVAVGPNEDYRSRLLDDNDLGDNEVYQDVVREEDAAAVLFVNFDAGNWLDALAEGDDKVAANLEPLTGMGITQWQDGEVTHGVLRITTD